MIRKQIAQLKPHLIKENRRFRREPLNLSACIRKPGEPSVRVTVSNLSFEGVGLERPPGFEIGDTFSIKFLGAQSLTAEIVWVGDAKMGCRISPALHPALFLKIAGASKS